MRLTRLAVNLLCPLLLALCVPVSASADWLHRVEAGESWSGLAKRFGVSTWDLALANHTTPESGLRQGQQLRVPPTGVVYVRPGQTLHHIARSSHCKVSDLVRVNRLQQDQQLRVGSRLVLPGRKARARTVRVKAQIKQVKRTARSADEVPAPPAPAADGLVRIAMGGEPGTGQTLRLLDDEGHVLRSGLDQLSDWMARELPSEAPRPALHPRLALLLARVAEHFDGREIQLFSGFRKQGGNTSGSSRHVVGRAADILVTGVSKRALWEFCRSLDHTGCGFYPRSLFVHVDARPIAAQWVDWSRPGQRARYGSLRGPFRRGKRGESRVRITRTVRHPNAVPLEIFVVDGQGVQTRISDARPPAPATTQVAQGEAQVVPLASSTQSRSRLPVSTSFKLLSDMPAPSSSDSI